MSRSLATRVLFVCAVASTVFACDKTTSVDNHFLTPVMPDYDESPAWSRDGTHLLYYHRGITDVSETGYTTNPDSMGLWIVDLDTGDRRMFFRGAYEGAWSPVAENVVMDIDQLFLAAVSNDSIVAGTLQQLTSVGKNFSPAWRRDGGRILFDSNRGHIYEVWSMNADGSDQKKLVSTSFGGSRFGSWFPDGKRVAYVGYDSDSSPQIFVANTESGTTTRLTTNAYVNGAPDVSPDGSEIVFHRQTGEGFSLWVIDSDGANERFLTAGKQPRWSPDGTTIAFVRSSQEDTLGEGTVWTIGESGSDLRRITWPPN